MRTEWNCIGVMGDTKMAAIDRRRFLVAASRTAALSLLAAGCARRDPEAPPEAVRITFLAPKDPGNGRPLTVGRGKRIKCYLHLEKPRDRAAFAPMMLSLYKGAVADHNHIVSTLCQSPRILDDQTVEYETEVEAPSASGDYILQAAFDPSSKRSSSTRLAVRVR
jgi:hypothetical protein